MGSVPAEKQLSYSVATPRAAEWWPVGLGLLVLYAPTYYRLATTIWGGEANSHGPIVFAVLLWALWKSRDVLEWSHDNARPVLGGLALAIGLLLYAVGRSQQIAILEVGSQIPVFAGTLLALRGWRAVTRVWFPLVFILFLCPLPSFVIDTLTAPLKQSVSAAVETLGYMAGYPIARSGVVLSIGPYQLLVADACSGLNSIVSLSALTLLYVYIARNPSRLVNTLLLASIVPIAFVANVIRVMALVLITYHLGDEAGQGFLHEFAGMAVFIVALFLLIALERLLSFVPGLGSKQTP